jgi:hypothetical protein
MIVRDYQTALRIARAAGADAANRQAHKAGRKVWSQADHECACATMQRVLRELGYAHG